MSPLQRYPGLDAYWPALEEVSAIATEAEALDDAVLLAVHRDTELFKRPFAGSTSQRVSQEDLLEHVLTGLKPEGYLLIPITGPSGAGKSHLVRWLEIRLKRHPRASRFHLVRIPKSASLRSVIEAILEPVADMAEYRELFAAVRDATSALSADEATAMFGARLGLALRDKAKEWRETGGNATLGGVPVSRLVVHASKLADFLQDPIVAPHFQASVYPRLLERALMGRHQDSVNADRVPQFELGDLTLPPDVERDLAAAAHGTRLYYSTHLERGRAEALLTLNAVIDLTVARVFQLGQSLQGRTLQDIMRDIREKLQEDGRELVLLVEDFYALTGIQEQLLSLCIQGTMDVSAGGRPICPMRTVMAMTDATLDGRDTIKTRSEFQWSLMAEQDSDEQVLKGVIELCARYLNAARVGRAELQRRYNAVDATVNIRFTPKHDDADSDDVLRAFGVTEGGLQLFPLTHGSIHFLARKYLQEGGRLVFNPRKALQYILRGVLLARDSFVRGTFPLGLSIDDPIPVELSPLLSRQPEPLRLRYQRLIVCWGNDPQTEAELRQVPPQVFLGFGLPAPFAAQHGAPVPTTTPAPTGAPTPPPSSAPDPADPVNAEWRQALTDWTRKQRLTHQQTNTLRKLIIEHVKDHVDWNALSLSRDEFDQESIGLPNTLGQVRKHLPERPVIQVTGPGGKTDAPEPDLALELLALLRFDRVKSWGYKDGGQDSFLVHGFLERIAAQLERAALVAAEIKLAPLAKMALRSAAVRLGMPPEEARLERLQRTLEAADPPPESSGAAPWDDLRQACWAQRKAMRGLVLRYVQVAQGTAGTPYAVDGGRLVRALGGPAPDAQALRPVREHDNAVAQEVKTLLGNLAEARIKASAKEALKQVTDWKRTALDKTGLQGSQQEAIELGRLAKELITNATLSHCWPASNSQRAWPDPDTQRAQAAYFEAVPWAQLAGQIGEVLARGTDSLDTILRSLPTLPWDQLRRCQVFLETQTELLAAIERRIEAEEGTLGTGGSPTAAITQVKQHLQLLDASLQALAEEQA